MVIETRCDCGKRYLLKNSVAGKRIECTECGDVFRAPVKRTQRRTTRSQSRANREFPIEDYEEPDFRNRSRGQRRSSRQADSGSRSMRITIDIIARLIGLGLAILSWNWGVEAMRTDETLMPTERNSRFLNILWFVFVGIPGLYIAIKGVNFSPSASKSRMKGWGYIAGGIGVMIMAVAVSALVSYVLTAIAGPAFVLGIGMFATGAVAVTAGVVAVITGQDMGDAINGGEKKSKRH